MERAERTLTACLTRGTVVRNTGAGLQVPVGDAVLGHIFNVWGDPLDVPLSSIDVNYRRSSTAPATCGARNPRWPPRW